MIVGVIADQVSLCHHPYQDRLEHYQEARYIIRSVYVLSYCTVAENLPSGHGLNN
jgi:hypothetical protein